MKTAAEIEKELDAMSVGENCTHDEYVEKIYDLRGAILCEEIDKEILEDLLKLFGK
jgi:hypothetical protein